MSTLKMTYYRNANGQRDTLVGKTCSDCCRLVETPIKDSDISARATRCGVTLGKITRKHTACILFPLVNGWQLIESSSSSPSSDLPKPEE